MRKEDKSIIVENIVSNVKQYSHFYLVDTYSMNAEKTTQLRRECAKQDIKLLVVKNTLLQRALELVEADYFSPLYDSMKGTTALMFSNTANAPAKLLKEFTKGTKKGAALIPSLKAAYAEESFYVGANQLDALIHIKSKNEVIAEVIALLQSPAKNVVSALQSGGSTIHGILTTLSEK